MSDHPKMRSAVVGVATALVFLAWLLSQMHGCDLSSWWLEFPMLLCFITILPSWARRAPGLGHLVLRSVVIVALVIGLEMAYLSWLHSGYFPRWLLLPRGHRAHQIGGTVK
jgi:hypothetical protein